MVSGEDPLSRMAASSSEDSWTHLVPSWAGTPLAENAIGPVICVDGNLRFLYLNPQAELVLGIPAERLLGATFPLGDVSNEFYARCETLMRRVLDSGEEERVEFAVGDGATYYWCRVAPERARDGSINLVVIARDITEAKRASLALGESAARMRSVLQAIPDMVFRITRDGTYLDFFPGIGIEPVVPPGEFLGKNVREILTEDFAPAVADLILRIIGEALDSGEVRSAEYTFYLPHGPADYEARAAPCGPDDVTLIVRDISARKQAERLAREREAWWRTLAENVPALITAVDLDGRIQYLNNPRPPLTRESVVGTSVYDYMDDVSAEQFRETMARVISTRKTEMYEIKADPGGRWYQSHIAPIVSGGEMTGLIIVSVDITERRELEQELAALRDEIEDRVEAAVQGPNQYGLSFRELTVLALVSEGKSDKEIAAVLGLRPRTVSKHVEKILRKMRCGSRTEAGVRAIREKLVP